MQIFLCDFKWKLKISHEDSKQLSFKYIYAYLISTSIYVFVPIVSGIQTTIYGITHEDIYLFRQLKILQALILPCFEKLLGFFANWIIYFLLLLLKLLTNIFVFHKHNKQTNCLSYLAYWFRNKMMLHHSLRFSKFSI